MECGFVFAVIELIRKPRRIVCRGGRWHGVLDMDRIEEYLRLFVKPGQVTELRAFKGTGVMNGWFDYDHLATAAAAATELERTGCQGIYFLPNPVNPELLELSPNRIKMGGRATCDADILRRDWLLVDVDPVRPTGENSSDAERAAAWTVASNVEASMAAAGFRCPIVASSGNGWHLSFRMDAENNNEGRDQAKAILSGLNTRLSSVAAKVDIKTFNAARIWKLYGTRTRKGPATEDRPHRVAFVADGDRPTLESAAQNRAAAEALLMAWERQARSLYEIQRQTAEPELLTRARAYLAKIPGAVSGSDGHGATFHTACILVDGWGLDRETALQLLGEWNLTCVPPWSPKELAHKVDSATKFIGDKGHLARQNKAVTRVVTSCPVEGEILENNDDPDATAEDLIALEATIRWTWPGWIQRGALTCLASDPGIGKTRLCADLARRLWHGLPWPDATPATMPASSKVMWVAADSQWAELGTLPGEFGFPPLAIILNGRRSNPYAGTNLDSLTDLAEFERRIVRNNPALVLVDTCGNATDRNQGRPEEAKQFFKPLAEIATRTNTSIVLVTHLNRGGQVLGNRIVGAVRQVIMLDMPEGSEENSRRLFVSKTNSAKPVALGVTMGTGENTYASTPTEAVVKKQPRGSHSIENAKWLEEKLSFGPVRVLHLRKDAEACGINAPMLYRARDTIHAEELEIEGKKYWRLLSDS